MNNKPFLLKPAGKDYLWGGERLKSEFGKDLPLTPLAETWECSTHPDGPSTVASGLYAGQSLTDVLNAHPEYLGSRHAHSGELPILIKFIDAAKDLSVQVHPTDEYAAEHENGQSGKSELWYVLDAAEDAKLVYGFQQDMIPEQVRTSIEQGSVQKYLNCVPIRKNDVFYVEAGTVHGIGAGALIAEIQENSNLTYRLYDYDRVDKNGRKRELHVDKALAVANLKACAAPRQPLRVLKYRQGCATEFLRRCPYFEVHRMLLNTDTHGVSYQTDDFSFHVLLCTEGHGTLDMAEGESLKFQAGSCIFIPANSTELRLRGSGQLLDVRS